MIVITVPYTLVWTLDFDDNYGWTKCGKCFNIKRQKELKQVTQGGSIGYNIRGKFYTLKKLKKHLTKWNSSTLY
jgi:hypothetical protein